VKGYVVGKGGKCVLSGAEGSRLVKGSEGYLVGKGVGWKVRKIDSSIFMWGCF
jgi:hypothetical protein